MKRDCRFNWSNTGPSAIELVGTLKVREHDRVEKATGHVVNLCSWVVIDNSGKLKLDGVSRGCTTSYNCKWRGGLGKKLHSSTKASNLAVDPWFPLVASWKVSSVCVFGFQCTQSLCSSVKICFVLLYVLRHRNILFPNYILAVILCMRFFCFCLFVVVLCHSNSSSAISWGWYDVWDKKEKAWVYTFTITRDLNLPHAMRGTGF